MIKYRIRHGIPTLLNPYHHGQNIRTHLQILMTYPPRRQSHQSFTPHPDRKKPRSSPHQEIHSHADRFHPHAAHFFIPGAARIHRQPRTTKYAHITYPTFFLEFLNRNANQRPLQKSCSDRASEIRYSKTSQQFRHHNRPVKMESNASHQCINKWKRKHLRKKGVF